MNIKPFLDWLTLPPFDQGPIVIVIDKEHAMTERDIKGVKDFLGACEHHNISTDYGVGICYGYIVQFHYKAGMPFITHRPMMGDILDWHFNEVSHKQIFSLMRIAVESYNRVQDRSIPRDYHTGGPRVRDIGRARIVSHPSACTCPQCRPFLYPR